MKTKYQKYMRPLAAEFCTVIREWFTQAELKKMVSENEALIFNDSQARRCSTGSYYDSNMAMATAWERLDLGPCMAHEIEEYHFDKSQDELDCIFQEHARLWNAAWAIAKFAQFDTKRVAA